MRTGAYVLVVAAILLALPTALAVGSVTIDVPDAELHVGAQTVDVGGSTAKYTKGLPVRPEGRVGTQAIDVDTREMDCTIYTQVSTQRDLCSTGNIQSVRTDIVHADVGLAFASAEPAAPEPDAAQVATQAALAGAAPPAQVVLIAAAAAGASLAVIYGVWRVLKWTGLAAFLPLYSHITDGEILDDPNRAAIYRLIQAEAGISTKDIADRLGLAWGTVTHHLGKLEKRRFVVSKKYGKYRRYFANGEGGSQEKDAVAVLRLDRTGDIAALIKAQPGLTQKAVSQALGVSSSTILWHVKRLEDVQLVRKVRDGKLVRYYPVDAPAIAVIAPSAA